MNTLKKVMPVHYKNEEYTEWAFAVCKGLKTCP